MSLGLIGFVDFPSLFALVSATSIFYSIELKSLKVLVLHDQSDLERATHSIVSYVQYVIQPPPPSPFSPFLKKMPWRCSFLLFDDGLCMHSWYGSMMGWEDTYMTWKHFCNIFENLEKCCLKRLTQHYVNLTHWKHSVNNCSVSKSLFI